MLFQPEDLPQRPIAPTNIYGLVHAYFNRMDEVFEADEPTSDQYRQKSYTIIATFLSQPELDFKSFQTPRPFDLSSAELYSLYEILMVDCYDAMVSLYSNSIDLNELIIDMLNDEVPTYNQIVISKSVTDQVLQGSEDCDDVLCNFLEENEWRSISDFLINYLDNTYLNPGERLVYEDNSITNIQGIGENNKNCQENDDFTLEDLISTWSDSFLANLLGIQYPENLYINPQMQELITPIFDKLFELRLTVQTRLSKTILRKN